MDDDGASVHELWSRHGPDLLGVVALVVAFVAFGLAAGGVDYVVSGLLERR